MKKYRHIWNQFENYFREGQNPTKLSATIALGMMLGLFPIVGTTTLLCFAVAIPLRLNIVIIQLANYLVYPLQLILFVPLIKFGGDLFGAPEIPDLASLMDSGLSALKPVWFNCLCGIGLWLLLATPTFFTLYFLILRIFINKNPNGH